MTAAPARFTFDLDLGSPRDRGRMMTDGAIAELARAASAEGYARGYEDGEKALAARKATELAAAAERLADKAAAMTKAFDDARRVMAADAARLALDVGRKLALHLIARQPAAELEALIEECIATLDGVPHLVIRCHPELAERIKAATEARIAVAGFAGRLVVIADPDVGLSDGRIEWADGGLVRDIARTSSEIDALISAFVEGKRPETAGETAR